MSSLTVPIPPDLSPACRARNTVCGTVPSVQLGEGRLLSDIGTLSSEAGHVCIAVLSASHCCLHRSAVRVAVRVLCHLMGDTSTPVDCDMGRFSATSHVVREWWFSI